MVLSQPYHHSFGLWVSGLAVSRTYADCSTTSGAAWRLRRRTFYRLPGRHVPSNTVFLCPDPDGMT